MLKSVQLSWSEIEDVIGAATKEGLVVCLQGLPGIGKSYLAKRVGLSGTQDVVSLSLNEDMSPAEIRGHKEIQNGNTVWSDGPGSAAWRNASRLVLDEIDRAGADVAAFLLALLDDPDVAAITLPTGETIRPTPGFCAVATMNGDPLDLDPALLDRLLFIEVLEPNPAAIAALDPDIRGVAAAQATVADRERRLSLRPWFYFQSLRRHLEQDLAGRAVFGDRWGDIQDTIALAAAEK